MNSVVEESLPVVDESVAEVVESLSKAECKASVVGKFVNVVRAAKSRSRLRNNNG